MEDTFNHPYYGEITGDECYALSNKAVKKFILTKGYPDWIDNKDIRQEGVYAVLTNQQPFAHLFNFIRDLHAEKRSFKLTSNIEDVSDYKYFISKDQDQDTKILCKDILLKIKNPIQRKMVFDFYMEEMSETEVAKKYNLKVPAAKNKIRRAIKTLIVNLKSPLSRFQFGPIPRYVTFEKGLNLWKVYDSRKKRRIGGFKTIREALDKLNEIKIHGDLDEI